VRRLKRKGEGGRKGGEGGQGWEGKFRGTGEGKGKGEGKFRGADPPNVFFLEPRLRTCGLSHVI